MSFQQRVQIVRRDLADLAQSIEVTKKKVAMMRRHVAERNELKEQQGEERRTFEESQESPC